MSLALALALICSMLVAVPSTASAMILPGSMITPINDELTTDVGQTILVGGVPNADGSPSNFLTAFVPADPANPDQIFNTDWSVAYLLNDASDPGVATVNKRTGLLTPTAEGDVIVDCYLIQGPIVQGNAVPPTNAIADPVQIAVAINASGVYGAQGNTQTVLMNTINGDAFADFFMRFTGDNTTGFQNFLNPLTPMNDKLAFNFTMAAGTGPNFDTFLTNNAGNIQLFTSDSTGATLNQVAILAADNEGILTFTVPTVLPTNTLTLNMDTTTLAPGSYLLRFTPDFRGNAADRTLDVNVDFVFSI